MNEQVKVLKQVELLGHQFTIYGTAGNPLFLAKDVANIIFGNDRDQGTNARIVRGVDYFEKQTCIIVEGGVKRKLCMLSLRGVYEVISMWSKKYHQTCFTLNSYQVQRKSLMTPLRVSLFRKKPRNLSVIFRTLRCRQKTICLRRFAG